MKNSTQPINYLARCRQRIENQLQWADSDLWRHQEFLTLSDKIFDKTGVALSVNTLKRLWGKVAYDHNPNATTLDALAKFVGYENWMEFIATEQRLDQPEVPVAAEVKPILLAKKNGDVIFLEPFFAVAIIGLFVIISQELWTFSLKSVERQEFAKVEFSSNKVVEGLPNTVIFKYDVSSVRADHYFIQQNWDDRRRFEIDPMKREATSVYYYPGYWRAKILADTVILSEHDLLVSSNGWLLTLDTESRPRYFLPEERALSSALSVDESIFKESIRGFNELPWFTAHYVADFGKLEMDNLQLELKMKNDYRSGLTPCQNVQVVVLGSEGFFSVPLCNPGCIGEIRLRFSDEIKEGKDNNLSAFGKDMEMWQDLKIVVIDKEVDIFLDGVLIESLSYADSAGLFYGVRVKFKGQGYINSMRVGSTSDPAHVIDLYPDKPD